MSVELDAKKRGHYHGIFLLDIRHLVKPLPSRQRLAGACRDDRSLADTAWPDFWKLHAVRCMTRRQALGRKQNNRIFHAVFSSTAGPVECLPVLRPAQQQTFLSRWQWRKPAANLSTANSQSQLTGHNTLTSEMQLRCSCAGGCQMQHIQPHTFPGSHVMQHPVHSIQRNPQPSEGPPRSNGVVFTAWKVTDMEEVFVRSTKRYPSRAAKAILV